jgi:hypothetical protein
MSNQWHYSQDGAQYGPVDEAEIVRLIQDGELAPGTPVCKEGGMDWQPARNHACFQVEIYPKKKQKFQRQKKRPDLSIDPDFEAELLKVAESTVNTAASTSSGGTSQPPKSSPRKDLEQSSDDEGGRHTHEPQAHETSSYRKPLIAGIIAIIAGTCVYLWSKAESRHNTLLTVHVRLIESERKYISELNKSTGELGFKSFISESRTFVNELDELSSEPGINIEDLPKEYLNSIASLKQVLDSVNNSARLRHLADLESHDEDRDNLRFNFDEIAEHNGLDLSRMPDIPSLLLIQKIEDFERAEESLLLAEKEQERKMAEMRRRQAENDRQARLAAIEAEKERKDQQERNASIARFNLFKQVRQDILDADNNYVFFCNANVPLMNNIRFENDRVIVKARFRKATGDFQRALRIGIGKGVFNVSTVEKMQRLIKSLDQESIDVQNWDIRALGAGNKIRLQLRNDIYRTWW